MIILTDENEKKTIQLQCEKDISTNIAMGKEQYIIKPPQVICSDQKDALYIQQQLNTFVNRISQDLINN